MTQWLMFLVALLAYEDGRKHREWERSKGE